MKQLIVVGVSRRESDIERLSQLLPDLLDFSEALYIPLPRGLCEYLVRESLFRGGYDENIVLRYLNTSLERLWRPFIEKISLVAREERYFDKQLVCYYRDDYIKSLEETGVEISRLLFLANVYGRIDIDSWIKIYEKHDRTNIVREIYEETNQNKIIIVLEGYAEYLMNTLSNRELITRKCVVNEMIPTPPDILMIYLEREHVRNRDTLLEIIKWIIKYFNEIIESINFDQVYRDLRENKEYMRLAKDLSLEIIKEICSETILR